MTTQSKPRTAQHYLALATLSASLAFGQTSNPAPSTPAPTNAAPTKVDTDQPYEMATLTVTGERASLATAQEMKLNHMEIVDSIVANDIGSLPDVSVSEALQRVTGVQITRDLGEGGAVTVRGLTQVQTNLNGREVFTAAGGRGVNFEDIPSELVSSIDVYKTPSANQIEGGLGGSVDVRYRHPFDFSHMTVEADVSENYGSLLNKYKPQISGLFTNTWKTGVGEIGVLVEVADQKRGLREDLTSVGNPAPRTDLIPGQTVYAPVGEYLPTVTAQRERVGFNSIVQWRPRPNLEVYTEANVAKFNSYQDTYGISIGSGSSTPVPGSTTLFPGTQNVKSFSQTNVGYSVLGFAYDTKDKEQQYAVGAKWNAGDLKLKFDASYTKSDAVVFFNGIFTAGKAAQVNQDDSTTIPSATITGSNLLDPTQNTFSSLYFNRANYAGNEKAVTADADYALKTPFFTAVKLGIRYADREAQFSPISGYYGLSGTLASKPGLYEVMPYTNYFPSYSGIPEVRSYLVGRLDLIRNVPAELQSFGINTPIPEPTALSIFDVKEPTTAGYLMTDFKGELGVPFDGNIGVRLVNTQENAHGFQTLPGSGGIAPINIATNYLDALPSLNTRWHLTDTLLFRAALSKNLTRPDFSSLSPSLTLVPNVTNPAQNTGSAGNPGLKPIRADQADISLEKYFSKTTSIYAAAFYKNVTGFLDTVANQESYGGQSYEVTRPYNTGKASISGLEFGYQQFFTFLPGFLDGLGTQANYTYVQASTSATATSPSTPLLNLSRNSYNLVLIYEKDAISARLAYNWRDKFYGGTANIVGIGAIPLTNAAYGWLDASVEYKITKHFTLSLEGSNLTNSMRKIYYGVPSRPNANYNDDTQIFAKLMVTF